MKINQNILVISLILALAYAAGLTYGIGPRKIIVGLKKRIIVPLEYEVLGSRPLFDKYTEIPCPKDNTFSIAYFGQSNATNTTEPMASIAIPSNLIQYDWKSSKCFAYREPLLGADFKRGNNLTYAAVRIANGSKKTVIVIPFGYGPSTVLDWAYGVGATQHSLVLKRLKESGLSPQVFLWHQGESDVPSDGVDENILTKIPYFQRPDFPFDDSGLYNIGISKSSYKNALSEIVQKTALAFPDSYFGIALVSHAPCLGRSGIWEPIREAQQEVAASNTRAFISADSDKISGTAHRYDSCHFSDEGARKLSDEYYRSISSLNIFDFAPIKAAAGR